MPGWSLHRVKSAASSWAGIDFWNLTRNQKMNGRNEPSNVLLISTDHWPGALLRPAGHPAVMTPTLDQLARRGTFFPNTYSACPVCVPARRTLMTGSGPRSHGDRVFGDGPMPPLPTLADSFVANGYQAFAVGKLHVNPPRDRIGFDDVVLMEEGRRVADMADDWEQHLADKGFAGMEFCSGASNNDYNMVPWRLPNDCHPTNFAAREMCRYIKRRDPRKPGFWYLSFIGPHPPVWPLREYLEMYGNVEIPSPVFGSWLESFIPLPFKIRNSPSGEAMRGATQGEIELALKGFFAVLTHIDHQIRAVLGTLREEGLLDNTVIAFTSDHGDMLGDHGMWAKGVMYERSACVPLIVVPPTDSEHGLGMVDERLCELRDIMPTLLSLTGLPVPESVEGLDLFSNKTRSMLYCEYGEGVMASRMIRNKTHKLIYYPEGNRFQLFDMRTDRRETTDLAGDPSCVELMTGMRELLGRELYGNDREWFDSNGNLIGLPFSDRPVRPNIHLSGQRGYRFL